MDRFITQQNIAKFLDTINNKNEKNLLLKQFNRHYIEKDFIRLIEKDANRQSILYTDVMLKQLIDETNNFG